MIDKGWCGGKKLSAVLAKARGERARTWRVGMQIQNFPFFGFGVLVGDFFCIFLFLGGLTHKLCCNTEFPHTRREKERAGG